MKIKTKVLEIPIIQGGMGIGVSLSNLAGHVAKCGAMGVISSANIGFDREGFEQAPLETNLKALKTHILRAKEIAGGHGLVAVNIMYASTDYDALCRCAVAAGADAIISGAGLAFNLLSYTEGTETLAAPIVSSGKAARVICRKYMKDYGRLPDFMIIEGYKAGGHLGFSAEALSNGTALENEDILKEVLAVLDGYDDQVPVFVAGGITGGAEMARVMRLGASGVQIATPMIATKECDAAEQFKQVILQARTEDTVIIQSPVGMPARAIRTQFLNDLDAGKKYPPLRCNRCLKTCKKGTETPYCISRALIAAVSGNVKEGLFFCGEDVGQVCEMQTVEHLINRFMDEWRATK